MRLSVFGLLFLLVAISLSSPIARPPDGNRPLGVLRKIFGLDSKSQDVNKEARSVVPRSRQSRRSHYNGGRRRFRKCPQGTVLNVAGKCTEPIVERRVYVYNSPTNHARQHFENVKAQVKPKIDYHLVLINKEEGEGEGAGGETLGENLILNEEEFRNSVQNFGNNFESRTNTGLPFNAANHRELLGLINQARESQGFQPQGIGLSNRHQQELANGERNLQRYVVLEQKSPRIEEITGFIREVNRKAQLRELKERQKLALRLSQNPHAKRIDGRKRGKQFSLNQDNLRSQFLGTANLPLALRTSLGNRLRLGSHFKTQAGSGFGRGSSGSRSFKRINSHGQFGAQEEFEGSDSKSGGGSESEIGSGGSKSSSGKDGSEQGAESSSGGKASGSEGEHEAEGSTSESSSGSETTGDQSNTKSEGTQSDSESKTQQEESGSSSDQSGKQSETEVSNAEQTGEESGSESGTDQSGSKSNDDQSGSGSSPDQSGAKSGDDQSGSESTGGQTESESSMSKSGLDGEKSEMESGLDDGGSTGDTAQDGLEVEQSESELGEQAESGSSASETESMQSESSQSESETVQESSQSEGEASVQESEASSSSSSSSGSETSESEGNESSSHQETSQSDSLSESENDIESGAADSESNNKSNLYSLSNRKHVIGNESYIKINIASIKDFPQVYVKLTPENETQQ